MTFRLVANVSSDRPQAVEPALKEFIGSKGTIKPTADGFQVEASLEGTSAKDLNRQFLSALRRLQKKTRLRSEWTSGDVVERFFDYVAKEGGLMKERRENSVMAVISTTFDDWFRRAKKLRPDVAANKKILREAWNAGWRAGVVALEIELAHVKRPK